MGTFSALQLAGELPVGTVPKVILHAPLTSLAEIAARLYWYYPVNLLLHSEFRFDNRKHVALLTNGQVPTKAEDGARAKGENLARQTSFLIFHGDLDEIVPYSSGKEISEQLEAGFSGVSTRGSGTSQVGAVKLVTAHGYGHNDLPLDARGPFGHVIKDFLTE